MLDLMPCGKKDCTECVGCKYDLPLDTPLKNMRTKEIGNFGMFPVDGNPSTTRIIVPGAAMRHHLPPFEQGTQLSIPFNEKNNDEVYCNNCDYLLEIKKPNKSCFNTRCMADTTRPGGSERVIKLNAYENEKIRRPFWCPKLKKEIINLKDDGIKIGGRTIHPQTNKSAMSDEQLENWNRSKRNKELKEKWCSAPGIMSWGEIKVDYVYHLPPTISKKRMDVKVKTKYMTSMQTVNVKTGENVWFYKGDEEYKFMSLVK